MQSESKIFDAQAVLQDLLFGSSVARLALTLKSSQNLVMIVQPSRSGLPKQDMAVLKQDACATLGS